MIKITCDEEKPEIVINLTVEVPSGGTGEGPDPTYIRIYSSVEEMEADTSAGPNDMGLVYHEGIFTGLYQHSINAWGIAETQLTLTESGEILPDVIAFGKNGIVTGDGSIWNNTLSPDEYQQALDTAKDIKGDKE